TQFRRIRATAMDPDRLGARRENRYFQPGGFRQALPAGGTYLQDAVRRGVVDGHPLGRYPIGERGKGIAADVQGEVRGFRNPARPREDAGPAIPGASLAVPRGADDRRSNQSAPAFGRWSLRQAVAEREWRPDPPGRAVEVRFQRHQGN